MTNIKVVLESGAKMPTRADKGCAGYDLYTLQDTFIDRGRNLVQTGVRFAIPDGWEGHIRPRSGFSLKGFESNGSRYDADVIQGTIDSSYRGAVGIIVKSSDSFFVPKGSRIAQIVFEQCYTGELEQVEQLNETERGEGGFGHSGVN